MTHYFVYLENRLKNAWKRPVMSDYGSNSFSGHDVAEHILNLQSLFKRAGLSKGDRVALYGSNSCRWAISFLAADTCHMVAVPLLSEFRPEDALSLVRHSEASVLMVQKSAWKYFADASIPSLKLAVSLDDCSVLWSRDGIERDNIVSVSPGMVSFPLPEGADLAVINYTSGTTSAPKGVMLTYDNINTNVNYCMDQIPPQLGDQLVSMLPMAHMYGLMCEFLYPMCGGVHIHFLGKTPTPALLVKAFAEVRPYLMITVPLVVEKIIKNSLFPVISKPVMKVLLAMPGVSEFIRAKIKKKLMGSFGGNLRHFVMGGAPLNPDVEKCLRKFRIPYTVGYGMTEAAPLLAYENPERYVQGSCGRASDRCEVRVDSADPQHIPGEIQARGMNIMKGYYKNEEATAQAFTADGWLRTGDLGVIDSDGNIFIRGRS